MRRVTCLMMAGLFAAACTEKKPVEPVGLPPIDLLNHRAIFVEGQKKISSFDKNSLPLVRIRAKLDRGWGLRFESVDWENTPTITREQRDDWTLLRTVTATVGTGRGRVELTLNDRVLRSWDVRWDVPVEEIPELKPAFEAKKKRRFDEAIQELEKVAAANAPWVRVQALVLRARIEYARGNYDEAIERNRIAAVAAERAAIPSEAAGRWESVSFLLRSRAQYEASEHALRRAARISNAPRNRTHQAYHGGLLAMALADHRRAERLLETAATEAWHLGRDTEHRSFTDVLALHLERMGRADEALKWLESVPAPQSSPTFYAERMTNYGWVELKAMGAGFIPRNLEQPRRRFEEARRIWSEQGNRPRLRNAWANLAMVAIEARDFDEAERCVGKARSLARRGVGAPEQLALSEAEMLVGKGRLDEATRVLSALLRETERAYSWRALHLLGKVRLLQNRPIEALAAWRKAQAQMERLGRRTALQQSRSTFLGKRHALARDLVELLLARGQHSEAFAVVDRSRASLLAGLDADVRIMRLSVDERRAWTKRLASYQAARKSLLEQEDRCWTVPKKDLGSCEQERTLAARKVSQALDDAYAFLDDTLPPERQSPDWVESLQRSLTDREAVLSTSRWGKEWLHFLVTKKRIQHELSASRLPEWTKTYGKFSRLFIVAGESLEAFDLLQTEVNGAPLGGQVVVSQLPNAQMLVKSPPSMEGEAVVVSDPSNNLPGARKEGVRVAERLDTRRLEGGAATRTTVIEKLRSASVFHFAGHGVFRQAEPWKARIELANDDALTMEDILVERPKAGVVVLNGCRTGPAPERDRRLPATAVGLPQAFLLVGATAVLASERDLSDGASGRFIERFYAHGGASRPFEAFRDAIASSVESGDDRWRAYRIWGGSVQNREPGQKASR